MIIYEFQWKKLAAEISFEVVDPPSCYSMYENGWVV